MIPIYRTTVFFGEWSVSVTVLLEYLDQKLNIFDPLSEKSSVMGELYACLKNFCTF